VKGIIHPDNAAELPDGLIGLYEEAFDERQPVHNRQKLLERFAVWALLKKEVSAAFVAEVLGESEDEIQDFIATYSAWFNSPESGKYQLYHERLKVYLLQKLSEGSVKVIIGSFIKCLIKKNQTVEMSNYAKEWKGLYFLLNGEVKSGCDFLQENINDQNQNWWENTFELYCSSIFTSDGYQVSESEINFYKKIKSRQNCINAAKLVAINFQNIDWDKFDFKDSSETRFHYALADVLNRRFDDLPKQMVYEIILDETHYLSYTMAYAWKYNCWLKENLPYSDLIEKIKLNGSPYLRILLRQIDGGRMLLDKSPILSSSEYVDCWEYLTEDFFDYIKVGKDQLLKKYFNDSDFCLNITNDDLYFIMIEFDSLHIQTERLQTVKTRIQKSQFFYELVEILWYHPAWEIGEFGNELVRDRLNCFKEQSSVEECTDWIYRLAKEKCTYSISILIFDIIEVTYVSDQYVKELIQIILGWQNAQIRGQFIASANAFFTNNKDKRWFELVKIELFKLCDLASDIWETQEIIELFSTLNDRLTEDEIKQYISLHKLLNKIPDAFEVDWTIFWKKAEKMRLRGDF
jgi:hypothetical protein